MKTTDPRDPLDQQIDALFASRPVKPSDDFLQRVCAAAESESNAEIETASSRNKLLRFALPLAAAIAVAFVVVSLLQQTQIRTTHDATTNNPSEPVEIKPTDLVATTATALEESETQDIFLLEEALSGFAQTDTNGINGDELLETLDALLLGLES
ncbi:hypothetical protein [Coraliomargarita akajimensis]|uniref:Uncharacterized protein n=1 Tax=Coraliomargarita akajimensis (strain DSM 45221 / IAM 15411 / JCM 23193 / KCTC 12865 / 04OKA010-24) TaxID=583355 RepID=D5EJA1_CORAD|nr:hypothetical protein [Coraliomargarita akajimensis]ADE54500.1 hypothetical protein Caka_1481 [Coraliomargarita akajimensis DSM 45221]